MGNLVLYGLGMGVVVLIIYSGVLYVKLKDKDTKTLELISQVLWGTVIFALVGLSLIVEQIYYSVSDWSRLLIGILISVPFILSLGAYIYVYIRDAKLDKITQQNKKYSEW